LTLAGKANIGGALSNILVGGATFTLGPSGAGFKGNLGIRNVGGSFNVSATAYSNGTMDIGGVHASATNLSIGTAGSILVGVGANLIQVASSLWGTFTTNLGTLCGVLSSLDNSIVDVVRALSSVENNVGAVASAAWNNWHNTVHWNLTGLAEALWFQWDGATNFTLGDLAGALSSLNDSIVNVVVALSSVKNNVGSVVSAVWNNWHNTVNWNLTDLAGALWNHWNGATNFTRGQLAGALSSVNDSIVNVVVALSSVRNNVGAVASAVWNNWQNTVNWNLVDLANALWNDWNGATNFTLGDLAGALSAIDNDLGSVVGALGSVVNDASKVASAVWNNWQNTVNWNAGNLVSELVSVFQVSLVDAWSIVNGL
jgi:hypothetical protein